MQFSITITGNKEDLANGLAVLKAVMGDHIKSGSVTAAVAPVAESIQQPAKVAAPAQAPTVPTTPQEQQAASAATPAPTVPTSAPTYDFNQLATATMQLQQAGQNIFEIFGQFGIQALNQLPKERYGDYAAALRERGAKI